MIKIVSLLMSRFMILIIIGYFVSTGDVSAQVDIEEAFPNLMFTRPVDLQHANDGLKEELTQHKHEGLQ